MEQIPSHVLNFLPSVGAVASVLNLSMTTMGFLVVLKRLSDLEQRMQAAQEVLQQINDKLDLSFYTNFRAALDLAVNTFTMTGLENRKASAMQALNRFAEARHYYTALADAELDKRSQVIDEYLSTLTLTYVAEARCFLELEECDTAARLLGQGETVLRSRAERYINLLLTSNPAAYLHPSLRGQIDLRRLTRVLQWLNPDLDENSIFEAQRQNLFDLARQPRKWIDSLPPAIWNPKIDLQRKGIILPLIGRVDLQETPFNSLVPGDSTEAQVFRRLAAAMDLMEAMIEDVDRFQAYWQEVQTVQQLGMSFREWSQLAPPSDVQGETSGLMYIVLPERLHVTA